MIDEERVLAYLKTNYGNPLTLLEARQKEMGAWRTHTAVSNSGIV
jgi:hypothetical protein